MRKILTFIKNHRGLALPMALLLMFITAFIAVPVIHLISTNLSASMVVEEKTTGMYAADAGIQYALWKFNSDVNYTPGAPIIFPENAEQFAGYNVVVQPYQIDSLTYKIESVATDIITGKNTTVVAYVKASEGQYEVGPSAFDYALGTLGGDLTISGSSQITCIPVPPATSCQDGDVYVTGNINMGWSTVINGTATLTGTLNSPNPGNIYGGVEYTSEPLPRPTWLDQRTQQFIDSTAVTVPSFGGSCATWTDSAGTYTQPLCINGNMTLAQSGTYRFKDTVYVKGNLTIQGGVNHVIFEKSVKVDGNVILQGNGTVYFMNHYLSSVDSITQASYAPGTVTGTSVDIEGYIAEAEFNVPAQICNSCSITAKLQHSNNGTTWTDVPGGTFTVVTKHNSPINQKIGYSGGQRYLRAVATVAGGNCAFSIVIHKSLPQLQSNVMVVGGYLYCGGSRSAWFEGQVLVNGASSSSGYELNFDGSKYSGVTWDVIFSRTVRVNGDMYFGSGRSYIFYDVIYATGNINFAGNGGTYSIAPAVIADGAITVSGSSRITATSYLEEPFLISRKTGGTGVSLTGNTPVIAIVYAPESHVYVSGSSGLEGAIVAKSALLEGNVRLKYPVILREREDIHEQEEQQEGDRFALISYSIIK